MRARLEDPAARSWVTFEPSTDFPTLEDEAPYRRERRWLLIVSVAVAALALGLLLGWWLARGGLLGTAALV